MSKWHLIATAGIAALVMGSPAFAQDGPALSDKPEAAAGDDAPAEGDIVVTGSRLKSDAPTGSALISVTRNDIDRSNAMTTSQLFLNLPLVNNLGVTQNSRSGNGGSANYTYSQGLNIHGLGSSMFNSTNGRNCSTRIRGPRFLCPPARSDLGSEWGAL